VKEDNVLMNMGPYAIPRSILETPTKPFTGFSSTMEKVSHKFFLCLHMTMGELVKRVAKNPGPPNKSLINCKEKGKKVYGFSVWICEHFIEAEMTVLIEDEEGLIGYTEGDIHTMFFRSELAEHMADLPGLAVNPIFPLKFLSSLTFLEAEILLTNHFRSISKDTIAATLKDKATLLVYSKYCTFKRTGSHIAVSVKKHSKSYTRKTMGQIGVLTRQNSEREDEDDSDVE